MKSQKLVGVIIVNYNNSKDTLTCLKSLKNQSVIDKLMIYLIDNCSTDNSLKEIGHPAKVKIIKSKINLGFAGGNNLGIKLALSDGCDQVLLINNDAFFSEDHSLEKLIKFNSDISAPIVKFRRFGHTVYDFGGKIDWVFGRNTHYEAAFKVQDFYPKSDYYTGACLLINKKVFSKIGFLDENYFLYYEDADFCYRAKTAGFDLKLNPKVIINHKLSSSANSLGKRKIAIMADSHFYFCKKHLSPISTPFFIAFNLYLRLKSR